MSDITLAITDVTNGATANSTTYAVTGSGIFDDLMETANTHLKAQFDAGRLRGEDYANAYVQIYIETLKVAMEAWLQKPVIIATEAKTRAEISNLNKQGLLTDAQELMTDAQTALYTRQKEGFNENFKKEILKICLDTWSVYASTASSALDTTSIPYCITKASLDAMFGSTSSSPASYSGKTVATEFNTSISS